MSDFKKCIGVDSQVKCSKVVDYIVYYKVVDADRREECEFYCCSDHVQYYRDINKRVNREAVTITKL